MLGKHLQESQDHGMRLVEEEAKVLVVVLVAMLAWCCSGGWCCYAAGAAGSWCYYRSTSRGVAGEEQASFNDAATILLGQISWCVKGMILRF